MKNQTNPGGLICKIERHLNIKTPLAIFTCLLFFNVAFINHCAAQFTYAVKSNSGFSTEKVIRVASTNIYSVSEELVSNVTKTYLTKRVALTGAMVWKRLLTDSGYYIVDLCVDPYGASNQPVGTSVVALNSFNSKTVQLITCNSAGTIIRSRTINPDPSYHRVCIKGLAVNFVGFDTYLSLQDSNFNGNTLCSFYRDNYRYGTISTRLSGGRSTSWVYGRLTLAPDYKSLYCLKRSKNNDEIGIVNINLQNVIGLTWDITINRGSYRDRADCIMVSPNSAYVYVVGATVPNNWNYGAAYQDILCVAYSKLGVKKFESMINVNSADYPLDIKIANNNRLFIAGCCNGAPGNANTGKNAFVASTDTLGNLVWKQIVPNNSDFVGLGLDGSYNSLFAIGNYYQGSTNKYGSFTAKFNQTTGTADSIYFGPLPVSGNEDYQLTNADIGYGHDIYGCGGAKVQPNTSYANYVIRFRSTKLANPSMKNELYAGEDEIEKAQPGFSASFYPNPVSNDAFIELTSDETEIVNYTIYNLIGQPVIASKIQVEAGVASKTLLDMSGLNSGNYAISINGAKGKKLFTILKL